jgi:hypothetical protein
VNLDPRDDSFFSTFIDVLLYSLVVVLVCLTLRQQANGDEPMRVRFQLEASEEASGEGVYKRTPRTDAKREPAGPAQEAARAEPVRHAGHDGSAPIDPRPLVRVYSGDVTRCEPCARFANWLAENRDTAPLQFQVVKALPSWVQSTPAFHFPAEDGGWRVVYGWTEIEAIRRAVVLANPRWSFVPPGQVSVGPSPGASPGRDLSSALDQMRGLAGTKGTLTFRPDAPVNATVRDGLSIRFSEIRGRYDLTGEKPSVVFEPAIEGTAAIPGTWGLWRVGFKAISATFEPSKKPGSPDAISVKTDWKTVRISLED